MADTKDLDAISKAPKNANSPNVTDFQREYATLDSPYIPILLEGGCPCLLININKCLLIITLLSYLARGEESTADHQQYHLANPYHVDDQQSPTPSICLANHVNPSSNGYPLKNNFTSFW